MNKGNNTLNLQGEQHQLPTLPLPVLPTFSGDKATYQKIHMDKLWTMCEIHLVEHDNIMVRIFL
jgi:hypothetical protein